MSKKAEEKAFYISYYTAVAASTANAIYCERLFGKNLAQHGFAEVAHIDHLIQVLNIQKGQRVLDLGCGSGLISEYLSDQTGAQVTGIDYIPGAIRDAVRRTESKKAWLDFHIMDMSRITLPPASFDIILSIDTLYFVRLQRFLPRLFPLLKPGGKFGAFFSQTWEPWTPFETFDLSKIHPDRSDLATTLQKLNLPYTTWEYTQLDIDHARRKLAISESLKADFIQEGNAFLYESHAGEANGILAAHARQAHGRWLYRVSLP